MGKITGFLEIERQERSYEKPEERIHNYHEFVKPLSNAEVGKQAARCMDCGIPFCHQGCPVNNQIPDWNNLVYRDQWRTASENMHTTNNFPEFTGRVCPAPCEASCTLNIIDTPVTIKTIECQIVDRAWEEGWLQPQVAPKKTGKTVAVVGSGPAGMACAQQLARAGHSVTLFEKNDRIGGLLRYGIPDFKMEKHLIDRRVRQMEAEGVVFRTGVEIGAGVSVKQLLAGSDCVGTSNRHGAASVTLFEIMPQPPVKENKLLVWPDWPLKLRTSSSHQEGCERDWSVQTRRAIGTDGKITALECVRVEWQLGDGGKMNLVEVPGSQFTLKADLVLLAMGFVGPIKSGLVEQSGVELDPRGNVKAPMTSYQTSQKKIFSCGDMRRGQSLVVWAIKEGRQCARGVDEFLMGSSELPR